jgi:hypothetical protein
MASFATEEPKSTKQKILEAGASLLQNKDPIKSFKQHLISVAFVNGQPNKQFLIHSFLNSFNDEFGHALLYDSETADAKLIGVQYIISERVFLSLPEEEKKFWYSFQYMVKHGLIVAPSLPSMAEKPLMAHLSACYGKAFLFWQTQQSPLPYGIPKILMGFTADGQVDELLLKELYSRSEVRPSDMLRKREKLPTTVIHPGANSWQQGEVYQLKLERIAGSSDFGSSNFSHGGQNTFSSVQQQQQQSQYYSKDQQPLVGTGLSSQHSGGSMMQGGSLQYGAPMQTQTSPYSESGAGWAQQSGIADLGSGQLSNTQSYGDNRRAHFEASSSSSYSSDLSQSLGNNNNNPKTQDTTFSPASSTTPTSLLPSGGLSDRNA